MKCSYQKHIQIFPGSLSFENTTAMYSSAIHQYLVIKIQVVFVLWKLNINTCLSYVGRTEDVLNVSRAFFIPCLQALIDSNFLIRIHIHFVDEISSSY